MTETVTTRRGEAPVYRAGSLAFLDTLAGLIPVTVTEVISPGCGFQAAPASGEIRVRVNAARGAYKRGEVLTCGAYDVVPRPHVSGHGGHSRINSLYAWQ